MVPFDHGVGEQLLKQNSKTFSVSKLRHKAEDYIIVTLQALVTVIGVDYYLLFRGYFIIHCELCGRGAGGIHQAGCHQDLCLDTRS